MINNDLRLRGQSLLRQLQSGELPRDRKPNAGTDLKVALDAFTRSVLLDFELQPQPLDGSWESADSNPTVGQVSWQEGAGSRTTTNEASYEGGTHEGHLRGTHRTTFSDSGRESEGIYQIDYNPKTITWTSVNLSDQDHGMVSILELDRQNPKKSVHSTLFFNRAGAL